MTKSRGIGRGGARPNSGPPKNPLVQTRREDAVKATESVELTPVQVMANNMRFWYDASIAMTDKISSILEDVEGGAIVNEELVKELNSALKRMLFARDQSQKCAADFAPYRHPRLANIEITPAFQEGADSRIPRITDKMSPKDAAAAYEARLREQAR